MNRDAPPGGTTDGVRRDVGRLCLDFAANGPHTGHDDPGALRSWLASVHLGGDGSPIDAPEVRTAAELHDAIDTALDQVLVTDALVELELLDLAVGVINATAAPAPPLPVLDRDSSDGHLVVRATPPDRLDEALALVARDLLALLADTRLRSRLHRCAATDCRRIFLAEAVGRPRRWCSSQGCGARTRVAAYRARNARDTIPPQHRRSSSRHVATPARDAIEPG